MAEPDISPPEQAILSSADVDQLVAEAAQAAGVGGSASAASESKPTGHRIQPFDFRRPAFLAPHELRTFRLQQETIVEFLASRLSNYLRLPFGLQLCELETVPYRDFIQGLAEPSHLTLFKLEPWRGIGVLDFSSRLAAALSDRLMGGKGTAPSESRELTRIEIGLLDQVVQLILGEWCHHWSKVQTVTAAVLGHENSARYLRTSPPDVLMVVIGLEVRLNESVEPVHLALPAASLEPLVEEIRVKCNAHESGPTQERPCPRPKWNRGLDDLEVSVVAQWAGMKLTAGQLASLKVGDVVPLPPEFPTSVRLHLAKAPKFTGRLGTCDTAWAVEITEIVQS